MDKNRYNIRHLARIIVEAATPLAIGSGEKDIETDAQIIRDVNDLPFIPATAIAGVIRHALGLTDKNSPTWGFQEKDSDNGEGSKVMFTNANIVDGEGTVIDGLLTAKSEFLQKYKRLPVRQHARIGHKGATEKRGKFDEEVCFKGTRFCFEMEMVDKSDEKNKDGISKGDFFDIIDEITEKPLRIGGGTRKGFGLLSIVSCKTLSLNLNDKDSLCKYISKTSSLEYSDFWNSAVERTIANNPAGNFVEYKLTLSPESFFLFGSGRGDNDADMTPVAESIVEWNGSKGEFKHNYMLIPATSVKGALSHRVAYHYNRLTGIFAEQIDNPQDYVGKANDAVCMLFGNENAGESGRGIVGNVIISDVIEKKTEQKILNHVAIDRFTGGAIDGALFSEKVSDGRGRMFELSILVDKDKVDKLIEARRNNDANFDGAKVYEALECALDNICKGMLPLGGGVNRGNGVFTGDCKKIDH